MPKYNETSVQGESWRRSFQLAGSNEYGKTPYIRFDEETAIAISEGETVTYRNGNSVSAHLLPETALTEFQLRNPETDEYIDSYATYKDLFVLIHSIYFHLAKERDKGPKPHLSWIWNEINQQWESPVPKPEGDYWIWDEEFKQWVDTRPPYPSDGKEYIWENGAWVETSNAS